MTSDDKRNLVDKFFDLADPIADKIVDVASRIHTPDKEYPGVPIASGTQSSAFELSPIKTHGYPPSVWHVFVKRTHTTLCGESRETPVSFDLATGRGALNVCVSCLSQLFQVTTAKPVLELTEAKSK